jgi:hypothetical protein
MAFARLTEMVSPFVLRLTPECFSRHDLLLKASKPGSRRLSCLRCCAGLGTSFTYVVGLDPLAELRTGVRALAEHVAEFPNISGRAGAPPGT